MMTVLRFIFNLRAKKNQQRVGPFQQEEFTKAETELYKQVQRDVYSKEIKLLTESSMQSTYDKKRIDKTSSIYSLNPYLDKNGVLRSHGRIDLAPDVKFSAKRPVILPRNHYVTNLLIHYYHEQYQHGNNETVTNELRQLYTIPRLRVAINNVAKSCQWCKINKAKPNPPMMSDLPPARLQTFTRPFSFVGIDYFGPMLVKVLRSTCKRWGMLITCLTTRAIHLELVNSLSTDSCILGIRNFISRRGTPIEIFSDCGTNFIGANRELMESFKNIDQNELAREFTSPNLKWTFNPPAAPHMGGSWERLVQSVKRLLNSMSTTQTPSDEVLRSILTEAENMINSRPLTYLPLYGEQDEALTPNHFLIGSSNGAKPISDYDGNKSVRSNWLESQRCMNILWKRFIVEMMPAITRRVKWMHPVKPIEVGDLVIIIDDQSPRNCWPKGRVIKTVTGSNGQVRRATVRTTKGVYERPAVKLAVLDVEPLNSKSTPIVDIPGGSVNREENSKFTAPNTVL